MEDIIKEQKETITRLKEKITWMELQYNSLREMHGNYYQETEEKLRKYLIKLGEIK